MRLPAVGAVHDQVLAVLVAEMGCPVHDDQAALVDATRPYVVVEWPPGGGQAGSAVQASASWDVPCRTRSVAVDPDAAAGPAAATRQAAQWAADAARAALLDVAVDISGDGWRVTGRTYVAGSGQIRDGDAVVIVDDYMLTVTADA